MAQSDCEPYARTDDLCICGHSWMDHEPRTRQSEGNCSQCGCPMFFLDDPKAIYPIRGP